MPLSHKGCYFGWVIEKELCNAVSSQLLLELPQVLESAQARGVISAKQRSALTAELAARLHPIL